MALTGTANSTSGSTLEGVQVAILDENDKIVQSAQAQVGGTSFSLKMLDDQIHFGELPTGCYTYMVIVTESSGETLCFASDFTVSDAATSTATYWSVQDLSLIHISATATVNGVSSIGAAAFQYQAERTLTTLAAGTVTAIHAREGDVYKRQLLPRNFPVRIKKEPISRRRQAL